MMVFDIPSGSRSGNFLTRILSISSFEAPCSRLIISTIVLMTPGPLGLAAPVRQCCTFAKSDYFWSLAGPPCQRSQTAVCGQGDGVRTRSPGQGVGIDRDDPRPSLGLAGRSPAVPAISLSLVLKSKIIYPYQYVRCK